ncbi:MAG: N-acetylmuramoyl-L-alanine amidase [Candidatus Paceibacterota bacterium]|jgi:N-acetyl-anhydromuramyl-L-alanine amidase AmpD
MNIFRHISPNKQTMKSRPISVIVIHATATPSLASPLAWLCDPKSRVSAHYLIDVTGDIYQLVDDMDIAWHAGTSMWNGIHGVNSISIGIELVNANDGKMPYSQAQVAAVTELVKSLSYQHGVKPEDVVAHYDVAPGRKNDPVGFDFETLRSELMPPGC